MPVALIHAPNADAWELIEQVRRGLPYKEVTQLGKVLGIDDEELARLASISPRTLARRREARRLNSLESERILRLVHIVRLTRDFFRGETTAVRDWLFDENAALHGQAPIEVATTEVGAREVENLLGRLAHGVPV